MTYGVSRDDAGKFLPPYLSEEIWPADPFATLDQEGVGQLVEMGVAAGPLARVPTSRSASAASRAATPRPSSSATASA